MNALDIVNNSKLVSNLNSCMALFDKDNMDNVLATVVLIWCIVGANNDVLQSSSKVLHKDFLILLDDGIH